MKLNPPKVITFWIAVLLGLLGFIGFMVPSIAILNTYAFWLVHVSFVLLVLALLVKGP